MKKYLILFLAGVALFLQGCSNDDDFTPPNYVTFEANELSFTVNQNSSESFDVTVYTANETSSDRTFTVMVDEASSINSEDYSVPATVTVPANSNEGTLTLEITDNTIADAGETLVLAFEGKEGLFLGEPLTINVLKLCEFTSLAPSYSGSPSAFGANATPFQAVLTPVGDKVFSVASLWGPDFIAWATGDPSYAGAFVYSGTITLNDDNTLTIDSQDSFMLGGSGTYNPCTGTFNYTLETSLFGAPNVLVDVFLAPNEE